ncbi:MAG: glycosyltransferase, partial [Alphaproteobacteria bacterium]
MIGLRGIPASYGGVERAVEELSSHLVAGGHEVTVYARRGYSDKGVRSVGGVRIVTLPHVPTKHLEAITHTFLAVIHAGLRRNLDIVHIHATGPALFSFVPRVLGIPVVATVQGLDWRREKWGKVARGVLWVAARAAGRLPNRTIVVSRELKRFYQEEVGLETVYIPNGVTAAPTSPSLRRPSELPPLTAGGYVLFLGRIVPEKHVHTLVSAFASVPAGSDLVIAGPSSHSDDYVRRVQELADRDSRVHVVGPQYGVAKTWLLRNAAVFVQPSSIEGLPIALLEAMAEGAYPIVSNIPENIEPVTVEGQTLCRSVPVDDPASLGRAIGAALLDPERPQIAEALRANVALVYDWAQICDETVEVYRDVMRGRSARPTDPYRPL